jgi:PAS domain S-box-containing protein
MCHKWVMAVAAPRFDRQGEFLGHIGSAPDISTRNEADAQLALAGKVAQVGGYLLDVHENRIQISDSYAAIYQFPTGTTEISLDEWRTRVHKDDLDELEALRAQSFATGQTERLWTHRIVRPDGRTRWIEARSFVFYDSAGQPQRVIGVNIDVTEQKQAEERQKALIAELDHRVKNVLAKIVAIVERTRETWRSPDEFGAAISGRIRSMANAHALLSQSRWQGVALAALLRQELAPYDSGHNTTIEGPDVRLVAEASQAVTTVLHELATNAAKYGALSVPNGTVTVRWRFAGATAGGQKLLIQWDERGGPPVATAPRVGFGTRVIRGTISHQLGGHVDLTFAIEGVTCIIELPAERIDHDP